MRRDPLLDFANFTDLEPITVTEESTEQIITIRHNPLTGEMKINYTRLDALQALGMVADAAYAIWKNDVKSSQRPPFSSGKSKVCVQVDGETLSMAFGTETLDKTIADPVVAKGILLAAWLGLCEKTSTGEFDPWEAFSGMVRVRRRA